jgi:putative DNA base modification enzyme with NMAD domain
MNLGARRMGDAPKFYLYKMTADNGGAPCVQDGLFTLAICKPKIRRVAPQGSVIIGFAGDCLKSKGYNDNSIVYAAAVTRRLTDGDYYSIRKYADRPDCIYRRTGEGFARKLNAMFHEGAAHLEHDLGRPPKCDNAVVLLSEGAENFRYFGNRCPVEYKKDFPRLRYEIEWLTEGHRVNHSRQLYDELLRLKERVWRSQSSLASSPVPSESDDGCDCQHDAVECD